MYLAAARMLGVLGLAGVSWAAPEVVNTGPDYKGIAAVITACGGILAILISAYFQWLASKKNKGGEAQQELLMEAMEVLLEQHKKAKAEEDDDAAGE